MMEQNENARDYYEENQKLRCPQCEFWDVGYCEKLDILRNIPPLDTCDFFKIRRRRNETN